MELRQAKIIASLTLSNGLEVEVEADVQAGYIDEAQQLEHFGAGCTLKEEQPFAEVVGDLVIIDSDGNDIEDKHLRLEASRLMNDWIDDNIEHIIERTQ